MNIHANRLKKYIRELLKEAYLQDQSGNRYQDNLGNDILPTSLYPEQIYDAINKQYYDRDSNTGTYLDYRKKYTEMDFQNRYKAREEGRPYKDQTVNIRSKTLLSMPVISAGIAARDKYIGPILSSLGKSNGKSLDYIIEPGDFEDMEIDGISIEKEVLPRLNGLHYLPSEKDDKKGVPFRIEVLGNETLRAPPNISRNISDDDTQPWVNLRNTVPLNDDQTEEAPGVYPRTEDIPMDYDEDATMDMDSRDLATLSAAERSRIAADDAGLGFGEFLPTGIESGHDYFFNKPIEGEENYMEKNYPGSKQHKYMKSYRK